MSSRKKKPKGAARAPRARSGPLRQRQHLIDACISALHIHGPSRTTVEKVVAIAKMSPGIVRFYFDSKAAMLVASLQFLAAEFEEQVLVPVARLKSNPVDALELMVDLYLDPEIASPRKVSVWYAFWGEASSRQEYYDICGQKDESFAALVRELIAALIAEESLTQLDPDGVALGLIGVLEMLWQDFAFQTERNIDRPAAKRRCMAYLRSVFPRQFAQLPDGAGQRGTPGLEPSAAAARDNAPVLENGLVREKAVVFAMQYQPFRGSAWAVIGHEAQIPAVGDWVAADVGDERLLVVRDAAGAVRAFRNRCTEAAHDLIAVPGGRLTAIECGVHGVRFALDGRRIGASAGADLDAWEVRLVNGLIFVTTPPVRQAGTGTGPWFGFVA